MIKTSLAFLAGVLAMAGIVYMAGARFAAPMFFAGMVAVVAPAIALLSSVGRIRTAARFLNAFADSWASFSSASTESRSRPSVVAFDQEKTSGYRKPSRKQQGQILEDTAAEYLNDADEIFGVSPSRRVS